MTKGAGHATIAEAMAAVTTTADGKINLLADPLAAEVLGTTMAEHLNGLGVEYLVIWDDPQPTILAHIVARHLQCLTIRVYEIEGLVEMIDEPRAGASAAVIAGAFPTENSLNALIGVACRSGLNVVAAATLAGSLALASTTSSKDIPVICISGEQV